MVDRNHYLVFTYGEPLEAPLKPTGGRFYKQDGKALAVLDQEHLYAGYLSDQIIRSALVLKLHQYEDTGGIIASGTTSLPEHDGERTHVGLPLLLVSRLVLYAEGVQRNGPLR